MSTNRIQAIEAYLAGDSTSHASSYLMLEAAETLQFSRRADAYRLVTKAIPIFVEHGNGYYSWKAERIRKVVAPAQSMV